MSDTLTMETIRKSVEKVMRLRAEQVGFSGSFGGMRVIEERLVPKYSLSKHLNLPADFRRDYNLWLLARFGMSEPVCKDGKVIVMKELNTIICSSEQANLLRRQVNPEKYTGERVSPR